MSPSLDAGSLPITTAEDDELEFIFLGTGTSSAVPYVDCLTAPPEREPCKTCTSTLHPGGRKNIRRNTSGVVRVKGRDGKTATIVIDAGKTFHAASMQWFPRYGLRKIDGVLITHGHADAMNGLDDLRGWTLRGAIQQHVDLYVSQSTFVEVQRAFPYLVSKEFASGGGDVPDFKWHIIEDGVPFEVGDTGVRVTPFLVHHGRVFSDKPVPGFIPTPTVDPIEDGASQLQKPAIPNGTHKVTNGLSNGLLGASEAPKGSIQPYLSLGFAIQDRLVYISDVSHIPDESWEIISSTGVDKGDGEGKQLPLLVLDCLRLTHFTSHFGIAQAVETTRKLRPQRTLILGFAHDLTHDEWSNICRHASGDLLTEQRKVLTDQERAGIELVPDSDDAVWMRPAYDGQRAFIAPDGRVRFGDPDDER